MSGSNLTFPPCCLPGCAAAAQGRQSPAGGGGGGGGGGSWMPRTAETAGSLQGRSLTPFLSESPAWIRRQPAGSHREGANRIFPQHTPAEIERTCCSNLSNYLPPFFFTSLSVNEKFEAREIQVLWEIQVKKIEKGVKPSKPQTYFPVFQWQVAGWMGLLIS